jgi:hypothetical protein
MVARFFSATCLEIDARGNEPSGYGWAEKEVIDRSPATRANAFRKYFQKVQMRSPG